MVQTKGQRKGSGCVKSQTYQRAATKYEQPDSVSHAGHTESASKAGCWLKLKTVRSEESPCSYGGPTIAGHLGR